MALNGYRFIFQPWCVWLCSGLQKRTTQLRGQLQLFLHLLLFSACNGSHAVVLVEHLG